MKLLITPGDPEGIGPEIVWKTLRSKAFATHSLLCVGARAPFEKLGAPIEEYQAGQLRAPMRKRPFVWLLPAPVPGRMSRAALAGYQSGWSIETATRMVLQEVRAGQKTALVTGPISKERLNAGGFAYPGHTEFLADLCGGNDVTMMLANSILRVTLVTTHLALKDVSRVLTRKLILRTLRHTAEHLKKDLSIKKPKIAVAALNPHAGEGGMFGKEEELVIRPALRAFLKSTRGAYRVTGPLSADTLFANHLMSATKDRLDAVVCMYHDQGLIPVKLLDFKRTVNVTLGLPIVRTSVDHGVAFDIAGKGLADPSSLQSAIAQALDILRRQK